MILVKESISKNYILLKQGKTKEFLENQEELFTYLLDLIHKEETILYPTALFLVTEQEFIDMEYGDSEIGYAFNVKSNERKQKSHLKSLDETMHVSEGLLTLDQINLIFKNMPVDISYVDENDLVKFYTDTKHRVFPRSVSAIERNVYDCHPSKSTHIVKEIIESFRNGTKDEVDFWINKEDVFIYIYYKAVRDENGKFRGVLEMMQDATHIRSLKGSQTLLKWEKENKKQDLPKESEKIVDLQINEQTKLIDIVTAYPHVRKRLVEISPKFKILDTPIGKIAIKKATVKDMSERSKVALQEIIEKLEKYIKEG